MNGNDLKKAAINKAKQVVGSAASATTNSTATANPSSPTTAAGSTANGSGSTAMDNSANKKRRKGQDLKPIITADPSANQDLDTPQSAR
jgi:hypothetical protein